MAALDVLRKVGFVEAGAWALDDGTLQLSLHAHQMARDVLYAFVSDDEVLYIGVSTQALARRMRGYEHPGPTQRTNRANHTKLAALLAGGRAVAIWVLVPDEELQYRGIPLNVAAGLEGPLITRLQPPWNVRGSTMTAADAKQGEAH